MLTPLTWVGRHLGLKENWLGLLGTAVLAITVSWAMSGCRFGNRVEGGSTPDPYTGYYEIAPQTVKFCMGKSTNPNEVCVDGLASQIPPYLANRLTNPVAFVMQDLAAGDAAFVNFNLDMTKYLPVVIASDQTLKLIGNFSPQPIVPGSDPTCLATQYVDEVGKLTKGGTFQTHTTKTIQGRIKLDVQVVTTFSDGCASALNTLAQCYNSAGACGAMAQQDVQNFLNPYLNTNLLSLGDVPNLNTLSYEVWYQ